MQDKHLIYNKTTQTILVNLFYYLAKLITIIHVEYANVKNVLTWIHNELFQKWCKYSCTKTGVPAVLQDLVVSLRFTTKIPFFVFIL